MGRAARAEQLVFSGQWAEQQGQSSKFSVVRPTEIEELSIKQRVSFGQRF